MVQTLNLHLLSFPQVLIALVATEDQLLLHPFPGGSLAGHLDHQALLNPSHPPGQPNGGVHREQHPIS